MYENKIKMLEWTNKNDNDGHADDIFNFFKTKNKNHNQFRSCSHLFEFSFIKESIGAKRRKTEYKLISCVMYAMGK